MLAAFMARLLFAANGWLGLGVVSGWFLNNVLGYALGLGVVSGWFLNNVLGYAHVLVAWILVPVHWANGRQGLALSQLGAKLS